MLIMRAVPTSMANIEKHPKLKLRIYLAGFLAMFTRAHTTPSAPPVRADYSI